MPTRLYLTDVSEAAQPAVSRSLVLPQGILVGAPAPYVLSAAPGSGSVDIGQSSLASVEHQEQAMGVWYSPPLDTQVIPAGVWGLGVLVRENNANSNSFLSISIGIYRETAGIVIMWPYDKHEVLGAEWATVGARGRVINVDGVEASLAWGDRIVVSVWRHAVQGAATAFAQEFWVSGTGVDVTEGSLAGDEAAWLEIPTATPLALATGSDPFQPPGQGRVFGHNAAILEPWYACAVCTRQRPSQEMVLLKTPNIRAGKRVCIERCLDEMDYGDRLRIGGRKRVGRNENYRGEE